MNKEKGVWKRMSEGEMGERGTNINNVSHTNKQNKVPHYCSP